MTLEHFTDFIRPSMHVPWRFRLTLLERWPIEKVKPLVLIMCFSCWLIRNSNKRGSSRSLPHSRALRWQPDVSKDELSWSFNSVFTTSIVLTACSLKESWYDQAPSKYSTYGINMLINTCLCYFLKWVISRSSLLLRNICYSSRKQLSEWGLVKSRVCKGVGCICDMQYCPYYPQQYFYSQDHTLVLSNEVQNEPNNPC